MNWITITWPMVAATCLTLGLIELRIGLARAVDTARLLFSLSAFATAAVCGVELAMMQTKSPVQFHELLRWGDVLCELMFASLAAFIWVYFRPGNKWLALAGPCVWGVALMADFLPGTSLEYREITAVKTVEAFGGVSFSVAVGRPNYPWHLIAHLGLLILFVFVV